MSIEKKIERLANGETITSKEPGNSMTPLIKHRQPVRIEPAKWEDVKKGDIVYCKVKGNVYTHLVKATNEKRGVLIGIATVEENLNKSIDNC